MVGRTLGHYEILEPLGAGGMGEVYRARDKTLKRDVAIKVLPEELGADPDRLARLRREAHLLAALNHANIATIHSLEEAEGTRFLVLELVQGESLEQQLASGPLPVEKALDVCKQVAEALEAAHGEGIIHRDLKPANVLVTPDGKAKVIDFGLAKTVEAAPPEADMSRSPTVTVAGTETGLILGTAPYMSPEQVRGMPLDKRADIWAFGCVLYEALVGRRAFDRETVADTLAAIIEVDPDWTRLPERTPPIVVSLLQRCLQKDTRLRLRDIGDAWVEITQAETAAVGPTHVSAGASKSNSERRTAIMWAVVATAVVTTALVVWSLPRGAPNAGGAPLRLDVKVAESSIMTRYPPGAVISPDGTRIAYIVGDPTGWSELHLRSLETGNDTTIATGRPASAFFSPDGQWVGFTTFTELKKVALTGGAPVLVSTSQVGFRAGATWSPDDTIIYAPGRGTGLFRISAAGGEPEQLTTLGEGEHTHRWPHALPASRGVLFTSHTEATGFDDATIEVLDFETGQRKVLHRGGSFGRYVATGHLIYANHGTLYAVPFDLDELEVTGSPVAVVSDFRTDTTSLVHFSVSDSGTLAYLRGGSRTQEYPIVWADRDGRMTPLWDEPGAYIDPRLSPDGSRLAVAAMGGEGNLDIWVYDIERGVAAQLTFDPSNDIFPVWSPDGEQLAIGAALQGLHDVYLVRADGSGEPELLAERPQVLVPMSWSRDGGLLTLIELSLVGDRVDMDVWVKDVHSDRELEVFLDSEAVETHPSFSPNARWIAYSSDESGNFEVYVRPYPPAPGRWRISVDGGSQPLWKNDGRELYYRTDAGVMAVPVETTGDSFSHGVPTQLFRGSFRGGQRGLAMRGTILMRDYDATADGQRFVMFPGTGPSADDTTVTLVLNWFEELKQRVPVGR